MKISRTALLAELNNNVCEIRFMRRNPKEGSPSTRRMLACNNLNLLGSVNGRTVLNFKPSSSSPRYNTANENTIITWDVFMQNWRTINCDNVELLNTWSEDQFWDVFNESFAPLSSDDKIAFMNT
tara:strand:+ start:89 stop:463 length:375 start_codon:yes stop_codon:yes gene_type:complete